MSPLWDILKDENLNGPINGILSGLFEGFKKGNLYRLFDRISLGPQYGIVLGSPVEASVGS